MKISLVILVNCVESDKKHPEKKPNVTDETVETLRFVIRLCVWKMFMLRRNETAMSTI